MPELPEVETVRVGMQRVLPGRTLTRIEVRRADLRYPIPVEAVSALTGTRIASVRRRGKYLLFACESGSEQRVLLVHLGMSGRLFAETSTSPAPPWLKHEHWRASFDGGAGCPESDEEGSSDGEEPAGDLLLRYVDARRFGALDAMNSADVPVHRLLASLGPEPLGSGFSPDYVFGATRDRAVAIKQWLMNSKHVVGVGNIYASEALWRARVAPARAAGKMSRPECQRLVGAVRAVLEEAIAAGGTTLRDFVNGDGAPGYFQQRLDVYGREGGQCHRCTDGVEIRRTVQQGRATYDCPVCQG